MPVDQLTDTIAQIPIDEYALMDRIATGDIGALEILHYRFYPGLET